MKQKIFKLSILLAMGACQTAIAQSGAIAVRLDIGAGLPSGVSTIQNTSNGNTTIAPLSYGTGFNIALAGNYMFSDHIGAGLDLNYMIGYNTTSTDDGSSGGSSNTIVYKGTLFAITPNIILSANADKINPYARFGIVIGLPSYSITTTETGPSFLSGANIDTYSGGLALGWYAGFGIQFPLSDKLKLNVELFDRDLTYLPTTYTNTQAFDGASQAPTRTLTTSNSNQNNLTSYQPFGSVGIKVGVQLSLGK